MPLPTLGLSAPGPSLSTSAQAPFVAAPAAPAMVVPDLSAPALFDFAAAVGAGRWPAESVTLDVVVSNNVASTGPLRLGRPRFAGPHARDYRVVGSNCGMFLVAGASCILKVRFEPRGVGSRIATLVIPSNGTPSEMRKELTGLGHIPKSEP
jgi:hypothetical protein